MSKFITIPRNQRFDFEPEKHDATLLDIFDRPRNDPKRLKGILETNQKTLYRKRMEMNNSLSRDHVIPRNDVVMLKKSYLTQSCSNSPKKLNENINTPTSSSSLVTVRKPFVIVTPSRNVSIPIYDRSIKLRQKLLKEDDIKEAINDKMKEKEMVMHKTRKLREEINQKKEERECAKLELCSTCGQQWVSKPPVKSVPKKERPLSPESIDAIDEANMFDLSVRKREKRAE